MTGILETYGRTESGIEVQRITLRDGITATVLTYGAIIERLEVPDPAGAVANVALGMSDLDGYARLSPHFGAMTGRYAGRIARGRFSLDGTEYRLALNNGANAIHGGPGGFDKVVWTIEDADARRVVLSYVSRDGEEGFPGTLRVRLTYALSGTALHIRYHAVTDAPTVLNLTNHSYFNLGGEGTGDVLDHVLQVESDAFLEADAARIPTGAILPVDGTPFDFCTPHVLQDRIRVAGEQMQFARGYDNTYVLRAGPGVRHAAMVWHPRSGRTLAVATDQPALQVYSGNNLTGTLAGPSGRIYRPGDGLCLETQHYPDSPNRPEFPSTVLRPGATFESETVYTFGITPDSNPVAARLGGASPLR